MLKEGSSLRTYRDRGPMLKEGSSMRSYRDRGPMLKEGSSKRTYRDRGPMLKEGSSMRTYRDRSTNANGKKIYAYLHQTPIIHSMFLFLFLSFMRLFTVQSSNIAQPLTVRNVVLVWPLLAVLVSEFR